MGFVSEVTHESFPGYKWLGYTDSREYLGDNDDDYCLKHFFLNIEDEELFLTIMNETADSFYPQPEGGSNWPCCSQDDVETLERIMLKSIPGLHRAP